MILCTDLSAPLKASGSQWTRSGRGASRSSRSNERHADVRRMPMPALGKVVCKIMRRDASGKVTEVEPSWVGSNGWQDSLSQA